MIREFIIEDLDLLKPNDMSVPDDIMFVFNDPDWWLYTMENNGIKAIICFKEGAPGEWGVFCLLSRHFNARDSVQLKKFLAHAEAKLQPKKVWTASKMATAVDKWHEFLGFSFERPASIGNSQYNIWSRIWDGRQHYFSA